MRARFYLAKSLIDKRGEAPIYINIHHKGHRLRYYTGERIDPGAWDSVNQRAKKKAGASSLLNELLDVLAEEPKEIERSARISGIDCTVEYLKERLSYNRSKPRDFIGVLDKFIKEEGMRKSWSSGAEKNWLFFRNNLARFEKKYRLEFESINERFAQVFFSTMSKHGWADEVIDNHIRMTIRFVKWARKKGFHTSTAYRDIDAITSVQKPEVNVLSLTIDEIARVNQLSFSKKESRFEKARDVFLFSCLTGLLYSDLKNLRRSRIKYNYLIITSQKTEDSIRVPLVDLAQSILEKYKDSVEINPLPVVSQQKYNEYLKEIGRRAELNDNVAQIHYKDRESIESRLPKWQLLTSHVGRLTFVSIAVYLGIPRETVSRITDLDSDDIKVYYEISDSKKEIEMQRFNSLTIS